MTTINNFADDIFTITRRKPAPKPRQYRATWPCGSTWEFDRLDLEIPDFHNGEQNGVTFCYRTIGEAKADLLANGCKVEAI
jgi:hypothetical protein